MRSVARRRYLLARHLERALITEKQASDSNGRRALYITLPPTTATQQEPAPVDNRAGG